MNFKQKERIFSQITDPQPTTQTIHFVAVLWSFTKLTLFKVRPSRTARPSRLKSVGQTLGGNSRRINAELCSVKDTL
jgi:hypothetical protein